MKKQIITAALAFTLAAPASAYEIDSADGKTHYIVHKETASAWWNEQGKEQAQAIVSIIDAKGTTKRQLFTATGCHPDKKGGMVAFAELDGTLMDVEQMIWLRTGNSIVDGLGAAICYYGVANYNAANRKRRAESAPASTQRQKFDVYY